MGLLDELFGLGAAPQDPWSTMAERIVFAPDGAAVKAPPGGIGGELRVPGNNMGMVTSGPNMPQLVPPPTMQPPAFSTAVEPAAVGGHVPTSAPAAAPVPTLVPRTAPAPVPRTASAPAQRGPGPQPTQASVPPSLMPRGMPAAPALSEPSFMDRFAAFTQGGQNGLLSGLAAAFHGVDKQHESKQTNYRALVERGLDPAMAQAVVADPTLMRAVIPQLFGKAERQVLSPGQIVTDAQGRVIARNDTPDAGKIPAGWTVGQDGVMRYIPGGPADPEYLARTSGAKRPPVSATEIRAINAAEDALPVLQGTKETLAAARALNAKTFSGLGAETGATIGTSGIPGAGLLVDTERANATAEWMKLMRPEAIQTMADTLKGATTDFELREFVKLLGDPYTPIPIRERVIDRMIKLAERQETVAKTRLQQMREKTYYQPGGGTSEPEVEVEPQTAPAGAGPAKLGVGVGVNRDSLATIPDGTVVRDKSGNRFEIRGGKPVPVQ